MIKDWGFVNKPYPQDNAIWRVGVLIGYPLGDILTSIIDYFRRYLVDLRSIVSPTPIRPLPQVGSETSDVLLYMRKYLGGI